MLNLYRLLIAIFALTFSWSAFSQVTLIQNGVNTVKLDKHIGYFVDKTGLLDLEDIQAKPDAFSPVAFPFSAGFSSNVHWFKLTLQRDHASAAKWLLSINPTYLDSVTLYSTQGDKSNPVAEVGDMLTADQQAYPLIPYSLPLNLPDNQPHTFYIRLQTTSSTTLNLTLRTQEAALVAHNTQNLLSGIAIGSWLMLCFYGFVMSWLTKKRAYALGCIYIIGSILHRLVTAGTLTQYIFPSQPFIVNLLAPGSVCLLLSGIALFFISFFETKKQFPRVHSILLIDLGLNAATFLSIFFDGFRFFAPLMYQASFLLFPILAYICWVGVKNKAAGSQIFLVGYVAFFVLNLISVIGATQRVSIPSIFVYMPEVTSFVFIIMMYQVLHENKKAEDKMKFEFDTQIHLARQTLDIEKQRRADHANFMALVTHELKTPLTVIDSVLQTLNIEKIHIPPAVAKRHETIQKSVRELNTLINTTLMTEHSEKEHFTLNQEPINVYRVTTNTLDYLLISDQEYKIDIPANLKVNADASLFELVLSNLLVNALKYKTPTSLVSITATQATRKGQEGTLVSLSNHYKSAEEPNTKIWFQKYYRQAETPNIQGVGLGLYLVQAIIEAHSGYIECYTQKEQDIWIVTFEVWIPAVEKD